MLSILQAQEIIQSEFEKYYIADQPSELYDPINYILSLGGKRIRPALVLLANDMFGGDIDNAIKPAMGVELFHNFTLLHDDIMDKALLRRGNATVHTKWNDNVAILSGDAMFIKAYQLMVQCNPSILSRVLEIFNTTSLGVCEGQQYDMNFETRDDVTIDEYMKMIEYKTSILLAACLQIGAVIAGASLSNADLMYEFGKNMGIAFQLQDDYLDIFGNEANFGKEIGKDILSNKKTFLLLKALELAKGETKLQLEQWINAKSFNTNEKIKAITHIHKSLGIDKMTIDASNQYFSQALEALKKVNLDENKKEQLRLFLKSIQERNN
jgi:geranylgeranyl diphosphate synthase type II